MQQQGWGQNLRTARTRRGLTMDQVMAATGIRKNSISNYEHERDQPPYARLTALCRLYGVTPDQILGFAPLEGEQPMQEAAA